MVFPILSQNSHYDRSLITLQIQLLGVCLAIVASIIAFKNYRRKSGDELYYTALSDTNNPLPNMSGIVIFNAKDKACVVFAIDFLIKDSGARIRVIQDNSDPIVISAYSSTVIKLEQTSRYSKGFIPSNFEEKNIRCICITHSGEVPANKTSMDDLLKSEFRKQCIFPQSINEVPKGYDQKIVPVNATHWLNIVKSDIVFDDEGYPVGIGPEYYTITGYFKDDILYITPSSDNTGSYLHGKSRTELYNLMLWTEDAQMNNYFRQVPDDAGLISMKTIKFKEIGRRK